ncbi:hypothetical protein CMI47_10695 [Candidatus Pacearchaeota archaeon]|nr:hypothetical protein [Candidatus Pacearchaeota archaeon]|tara:strand:+ start:94 stop:318 length:225 start_codon:yes stop_codon:yes gene_type:complete
MNKKEESMKLSNQALGAIMMALQESLMNQLDIVPILQNFDLIMTQDGLIVNNPPTVRMTDSSEITEQDLAKMVK